MQREKGVAKRIYTNVVNNKAMKSTKRQQAVSKACEAYEALCKYRGVPCDIETSFYIGKNLTISQIDGITTEFTEKLNETLQPATEKQMAYIKTLAKDWKDEELYDGVSLNKYQASELIKLYKYANELLYSNAPFAGCNETWEEIDNSIKEIIDNKTL